MYYVCTMYIVVDIYNNYKCVYIDNCIYRFTIICMYFMNASCTHTHTHAHVCMHTAISKTAESFAALWGGQSKPIIISMTNKHLRFESCLCLQTLVPRVPCRNIIVSWCPAHVSPACPVVIM